MTITKGYEVIGEGAGTETGNNEKGESFGDLSPEASSHKSSRVQSQWAQGEQSPTAGAWGKWPVAGSEL